MAPHRVVSGTPRCAYGHSQAQPAFLSPLTSCHALADQQSSGLCRYSGARNRDRAHRIHHPERAGLDRACPTRRGIALLNLTLGWTVLGWIVALVWVLFDEHGNDPEWP
ncbi:superinfection immunity protein [Acidithiobacillus caldus]|nr:superinfection immunity protein [Acidithiobacillus caldus]